MGVAAGCAAVGLSRDHRGRGAYRRLPTVGGAASALSLGFRGGSRRLYTCTSGFRHHTSLYLQTEILVQADIHAHGCI